ncbi:MAG: DNA gyrase subunit A [Rickettsiales bacterium]|jgi:DNA gyrase subunit A|nr:DNA gyrase subunit A [Rickettsiales bacterium]
MSGNKIGEESKIAPDKNVKIAPIVHEMQKSYLDYAMSVIISRALPDVRDGLKPVHRRIIYSMKENGFEYGKPFRKSARVVGDVMGKYHPHGDAAIYDSMVRMSQDFSMGLTMVDGQGNFGSMDGDSPAAMRYTEARMSKAAAYMVEDLDKDTVDWRPNYDESTKEPEVLPARFPNLLVNGSAGIAVGMATNIPTHNLGEVIDAACALVDDPDASIDDLVKHMPAPDFPTGGIILGLSGAYSAYTTGRGSVVIRAKTHFEEVRTKTAIIVDEIPYQVNKKVMVEKIAELVKDKRIEGISDLRDESSRQGVRVVIELKKDAVPDVVLNRLFKFSPLQTSFGVNMLAIDKGRPGLMNLKQLLEAFVEFREEVIRRRTAFDLARARAKAHVLVGLSIAVANLDDVIALIRSASDPNDAKDKLMARDWKADEIAPLVELIDDPDSRMDGGTYRLTEAQAKAILELKLHRLTGLELDKLADEIKQTGLDIKELLSVLMNRTKLRGILKDELLEVREKFAVPRKTAIEPNEFETDMEDLIAREDMAITITNTGYIKRVPLATYRAQNRGGKGRTGMNTKDEDFVADVFVANTHTPVVFFSNRGIAYQMKVYRLPLASPQSVGKAIINLLPLEQGETISTIMPLPENESERDRLSVMFATSRGTVRRNRLSDFMDIRRNGKIAMKFDEDGDELVAVKACGENDDVFLSLRGGRCIRFPVGEVRVFQSRTSNGIRGIKVAKGDAVISMSIIGHTDADADTRASYLKMSKALRREEDLPEDRDAADDEAAAIRALTDAEFRAMAEREQFILTITETGFGKRTSSYEYRTTHRGGSGIANVKIAGKTKAVVSSFPVKDNCNVLLVTDGGKMIRLAVSDIRIAGRQTMGVTLLKTAEGEKVVSSAIIAREEEEDVRLEQDNVAPPTPKADEAASAAHGAELAPEPVAQEPAPESEPEPVREPKMDLFD